MKPLYLFLFLLLCSQQLSAQNKGMIPTGKQLPAGTERRLALVIGNKYYTYAGRLNNTHNDADDMAKVLQNLGFDVILKKDLSMIDFLKSIDDFGTKLGQYNVGLLYYSGHGIQYQGENYLVPIDAKPNTVEDIEYTCVKLGRAMAKMEGAKLKVSLAFLDACRNNPFPSSSRAVGQGLTIPNNPPGSFVVFSTRAGSTADDNSSGRNGLFTSALLQNLSQANVGLRTMIDNVIETVTQRSGNSQIPGRYDELRGDFYFLVGGESKPEQEKPIIIKREEPSPISKRSKKLFPYEPEIVFVRGGTFNMGSNDDNLLAKPMHQVILSDYYIGKYEVTQEQWKAVMGNNPSEFKGCPTCPVNNVNWNDIQKYLQKLNALTGKIYRLPTEAEWEYAARGGSKSKGFIYSGGDDIENIAWWYGNSNHQTHPVGQKKPNELGIYDMTGSQAEWCNDWFDENYYKNSPSINPKGPNEGTHRIVRGASWRGLKDDSRVYYREVLPPNNTSYGVDYGLRIVLEH